MTDRFTRRAALRDAVRARAFDRCEFPACPNAGQELAHLHSVGMGGRVSADDPDNAMWACRDHARITDGEYGSGGVKQYRDAHALLGLAGVPPDRLGWERAEALVALVRRKRRIST